MFNRTTKKQNSNIEKLEEKKKKIIIELIVIVSFAGICNIIYQLLNQTEVKFLRFTDYGKIYHEIIGLIMVYKILKLFYISLFKSET